MSSVAARHVDILPTILDAVGQPRPGDLPGRSLLPAAERRAGASPRPSYFEAMGGDAQPRLGAADRRARRPRQVHRPADPRALRPGGRSRRTRRTSPADRRSATARSRRRLRALQRIARPASGAPKIRTRPRGCARSAMCRAARRRRRDTPTRTIRSGSSISIGPIHDAVEAFGARPADEAVRIYQRVIARRPDMAIAYRHLAFVEWQRGNPRGADRRAAARARSGRDASRRSSRSSAATSPTPAASPRRSGCSSRWRAIAGADAETLNALGIAYVRAGRRDEARARRSSACSRSIPTAACRSRTSGCWRSSAATSPRRAGTSSGRVRADPRSSRAHAGLGVVALREGRNRAAAIDAWTRAVQLDPAQLRRALQPRHRRSRATGRLAAARPYLEQFLSTAPPAFYAKDLKEVAGAAEALITTRTKYTKRKPGRHERHEKKR